MEITADNLERAERILKIAYSIGTGDVRIVLDRARVDREAWEAFAQHHKKLLFDAQRGYLPEIDPRQEPAIMTMLLHFFAVGAISQRLAMKGEE